MRTTKPYILRVYLGVAALCIIIAMGIQGALCGDSDWPMWRRDRQNTGHSPLLGNMNRSPEILWSHFVGGYAGQAFSLDINRDGIDEVIFLSAGKVKAVDSTGMEVWRTRPMEISAIFGTEDLGRDGSMEIIVSSPSTIFILDAKTGEINWNYSFPSPASGLGRYGLKIENINEKFPGDELLVWPSKSDTGYAFGFPEGASNGELIWKAFAPETRNYPPPIAVADLDLDGVNELVLATLERIYSFDGETGERKMYVHSPAINRNYGTLIITDLDQDPYPEIAVLCSNLNEHLWVVDNDGTNLTQIWNKHFEYSYPDDFVAVRLTVDSVSDFDGDGSKEIVYSILNQSSDSRWHTKILDALTGSEEMEFLDEYLLAEVDLDGDGVVEIVTSEQHQRSISYCSNVTIRNIALGWEIGLDAVELAMDCWSEYPPGTNTIAEAERWRSDKAGFMMRANGSIGFLRIVDGAPIFNDVVNESKFGFDLNIRSIYNGTGVVAGGNDGWLRIFDFSGRIIGKSMTGGYLPSIIAADLDRDGLPEVIVQESKGQHVILEPDGSKITQFSGEKRRAKFGKDGSFVVWDMDGDGDVEILSGGSSSLLVLDQTGNQTGSYALPSDPYDWMAVNITGDPHWDLFVCSYGSGPHTANTLAIDGLTGEVLWEKNFGTYAGFMGIMDYDGDGLDDLVMREHFDFFVLIGPTGAEKKGHYLCGYHAPIINDVEGDGKIEVIWGGGWGSLSVDRLHVIEIQAGQYHYMAHVWEQLFGGGDSNEVYAKMPAVADVDGDRVMEVGAGNRNGTIHCFDGSDGRLEWNFFVGSNPSDIISCDIDSDGRAEYIFGTSDGRLISLGPEGIEWSLDFGDPVGDAIICDLDGDKMADILVPVMDGNIYALHIHENAYTIIIAALLLLFKRMPISGTPRPFHMFQRTHK